MSLAVGRLALIGVVVFWHSTALLAQEIRTLPPAELVPLHSIVDVSTLPAPSRASPSGPVTVEVKPFLTPDPEGLRLWRELLDQHPEALPPAPGVTEDGPRMAAPVVLAPTVFVQFEGLGNSDNSALASVSVIPPDDNLGVGPNHIFEMVNIVGRISTKAGGPVLAFTLGDFFQASAGFTEADPHVIFDAVSGRWFATLFQKSPSLGTSSIILAVSVSNDPTGLFCRYRLGNPTAETFEQDFPMLGVSDDKVVVSYNGFAFGGGFLGAGYYVLNKADLTACLATVRQTRVAPTTSLTSPHGAQALGSTSDAFLAMHGSASTLSLLTISGTPGFSPVTQTTTTLGIRSWTPPPNAVQAGSNVLLDTSDDRVLSPSWQTGSLWLAGNEACTPTGDSVVRSCLRLIEVRTTGPSVRQDMTFGAAGAYDYYPALRPDSAGNVHVVFTQSSATTFASVRVTGRLAGDPLNTLQASAEIRTGAGAQTDPSGRMGDYSGAAVDPSNTAVVWVSGEYITATADWGTWIAQLAFSGPPPSSFTLTVQRTGSGSGTVTSSPAGIACGGTCAASFMSGTAVTLTATPAAGSVFAGWSGGGCTGTGSCVVTVSVDTTVTATFNLASVTSTLVAAVLPSSRSVQVGTAATAFATIINTGATTALGCALSPTTSLPASFSYQTTDPATNQLIGTPNTPVAIAAGAAQTFVFAMTPSSAIAPTEVMFTFGCSNTAPAPSIVGVNTLLLSASATPVPDIIAIGSTINANGIVDIPGPSGTGLFAVATSNVGTTGTITVSADTGGVSLPLQLTVCETNTATGACLAPPGPTVTVTYAGASTRSFGIFAQGTGTAIAFNPAANRIFVRFQDATAVIRGATSVAVRTQ